MNKLDRIQSEKFSKQEARHETVIESNEWILENCSFGFFDIETGNLNAPFSRIIGACILERGKSTVLQYQAGRTDKVMLSKLRNKLEEQDYVVTYYGTGFDIPYLNTRLIIHGLRPLAAIRHIDLYYTARHFLKLHSNRLATVGDTLLGASGKTQILPAVWEKALTRDKAALKYVMEHCVADVEDLERVFDKLVGFRNLGATPLKGGYFG